MLRTLSISMALLVSSFAWAGDGGSSKWDHHSGDMEFVIGFDEGLAQSKATGKPMLLFFTTTWCGYCKKIAGESFTDPSVVSDLVSFVPVIVDGDTEKETCKKYGVSGYPNIKFMTPDGKVHGEIRGYVPTESFKSQVADARKSMGKIECNPKYLEALEKVALQSYKKKDYRKSLLAIIELEKNGKTSDKLTAAKAKMEKVADANLQRAKAILAKDPENGKKILAEIRKAFAGLPAATEAMKLTRTES